MSISFCGRCPFLRASVTWFICCFFRRSLSLCLCLDRVIPFVLFLFRPTKLVTLCAFSVWPVTRHRLLSFSGGDLLTHDSPGRLKLKSKVVGWLAAIDRGSVGIVPRESFTHSRNRRCPESQLRGHTLPPPDFMSEPRLVCRRVPAAFGENER